MAMFFLLLGFLELWAITEIVETILEKRRRHTHVHHLKWLD